MTTISDTICRHVAVRGSQMRWALGLVGTRIDCPSISVNVMEFDRPDCLEDVTNRGV